MKFLFVLLLLLISPYCFSSHLSENFCRKIEETNSPLSETMIQVDISTQRLLLFSEGKLLTSYPISSGLSGTGQVLGSEQTPLGLHRICQKIGAKAPIGTIFRSKKSTGKLNNKKSNEDLILTRILVLEGLEAGFNKGKDKKGEVVDSFQRCIYIHGTNHEELIGKPVSKGCIRMKTTDLLDLFQRVNEGTLLWIE